MAVRYEITDRHGRKRIVDGDDDLIVPDGATLRVPLMLRDSASRLSPLQRAVASSKTDGFDALAQCRNQPGHVLSDAAAREIKEAAYLAAKAELSNAWRTPPVAQSAPAAAAPAVEVENERPAIPITDADFARLRQIRDESYRAMVAEMESAWRKPSR